VCAEIRFTCRIRQVPDEQTDCQGSLVNSAARAAATDSIPVREHKSERQEWKWARGARRIRRTAGGKPGFGEDSGFSFADASVPRARSNEGQDQGRDDARTCIRRVAMAVLRSPAGRERMRLMTVEGFGFAPPTGEERQQCGQLD
jgi:hypothetical protein